MNMRTGGNLLFVLASAALMAVFAAGCNDDDDPDTSSELDGYFADHPYVSDPRASDGRGAVVSISPAAATVISIGAKVVFSVSGGTPPYTWDVSNGSMGTAVGSGESLGVYTALAIGANNVIVYDQSGNAAYAPISGSLGALAITPAAPSLGADNAAVVLKVTGGTAPYTWTVMYPSLGNFPSGNTGTSVIYVRYDNGDNAVTVTDGAGSQTSVVVAQP
jgi:hypothetical protein